MAGPQGKKGYTGDKGITGKHGFVGGPVGRSGSIGENIDELCQLAGVRYNDIDGVSDTAIVDLDISDNGNGCNLILKKAKLNIPGDIPADKIIASLINRNIVYNADPNPSTCSLTRLSDWKLVKDIGDNTPMNLNLLRLSTGSDTSVDPVGVNNNLTLRQFVKEIVAEYKDKLTKIDRDYGKQAKEHITNIDNKARTILSDLANQLSMCEFNLPAVEFGITFTGCDQPPLPPPPPPPYSAFPGVDVDDDAPCPPKAVALDAPGRPPLINVVTFDACAPELAVPAPPPPFKLVPVVMVPPPPPPPPNPLNNFEPELNVDVPPPTPLPPLPDVVAGQGV
jgi:hypothetical protein